MSDVDPDRDLVARAQAELPYGVRAYNELVRRYTPVVYQRAFGILRSPEDAEEATQDVFLSVFRSIRGYRPDRPFSHWLSVVTLNCCRMILRRRAQEQRKQDAIEAEPVEPAPVAPGDPALRRTVNGLLDSLDPGTRIPLIMRFVEGRTYAEIAAELDLSESAAKMRVSRGAKRLRELYDDKRAEAERRLDEEKSDG